jgi:hypothetical protein
MANMLARTHAAEAQVVAAAEAGVQGLYIVL